MRSWANMKFIGFLILLIMLYDISARSFDFETVFWILFSIGLMANRFIGEMLLAHWRAHVKRK